MSQIVRGLAVLGIVWTICIDVLMLLVTHSQPGIFGLAVIVLLLIVFARLYQQKRWALAATCGYCWWTAATSLNSGLWQWTLGWVLVALLTTLLCLLCWATLEPGF